MKHYCTFYTLKKYKKLLRKRTHRLQNLKSLTRFAFRNPNVITYGYATFDLLLQNSSITKQKSIGSFIVTLMNSPITKQKSIGSFIVTLMNSPITKRCFVIADGFEESQVFFIEIFPPFSRQNGNVDECMCNSKNNIRLRLQADIIYNNVIESYLFTGIASMRA